MLRQTHLSLSEQLLSAKHYHVVITQLRLSTFGKKLKGLSMNNCGKNAIVTLSHWQNTIVGSSRTHKRLHKLYVQINVRVLQNRKDKEKNKKSFMLRYA